MHQDQAADNPYAAPGAVTAQPRLSLPAVRFAGFWWRVLAALVDMLVLLPVSILVKVNEWWWHVPAIGYASLLVFPVYKVLMDSRGGTVGKFACGIRITDPSGGEPGIGRSLSRNIPVLVTNLVNLLVMVFAADRLRELSTDPSRIGELAPLIAPSLLISLFVCVDDLSVAFSEQKRALHDRWAGTWCVRPLPADADRR